MDLEATGWENITFRCAFMGLTFARATELSSSIVEFSELGGYLDMPVRTYSAGMFLRLAFAISTSVQPDIVIMDELIGAGDAQFYQKAQKRLQELIGNTKILILASHDQSIIRDPCNKALWLEHGTVKIVGPAEDVVKQYLESVGGPKKKAACGKDPTENAEPESSPA
jgi:ABC-type polysaccharide/polyol phosphate transport system ATPase subunit